MCGSEYGCKGSAKSYVSCSRGSVLLVAMINFKQEWAGYLGSFYTIQRLLGKPSENNLSISWRYRIRHHDLRGIMTLGFRFLQKFFWVSVVENFSLKQLDFSYTVSLLSVDTQTLDYLLLRLF